MAHDNTVRQAGDRLCIFYNYYFIIYCHLLLPLIINLIILIFNHSKFCPAYAIHNLKADENY